MKPGFLTRHQDFWLFIGLLLWLGIFHTLENASAMWRDYFVALLVLIPVQLPTLVFAWKKERLSQILSSRRYLKYWLFCFGICLPASTILCILVQPNQYHDLIIVSSLCSYTLELLLAANAYYQTRGRQSKWIRKIDLDSALLISVTLISVTLAAMAVSSLNDPIYHTKEQLLIGFEFSIVKIIRHFGTFLSIALQFLFMYLCGYLFYYINSRFLVSKVLKRNGLVLYVLSVLATISFLYPIVAQLIASLPMNQLFGHIFPTNPFKLENAFAALAIMLVSLPIVLALQWARQNSQIMALEKEKTQTELDLLKQQLNPHFFFNTLNNLYAMSLQQSKQTPESILQLSELMRYVIYKGQESTVTIRDEVKYLDDYIQLQRIRLRKSLDFQFKQVITDDHQTIAPLLLIVFVENAFKHGIESADNETILHLELRCDSRQLYFRCENSVESAIETKEGIGLSNLKRRLALLYPSKHVLKTTIQDHTFTAELQLDLS
ncbi:histidine kinase [Spirosoma aureum]|uniref:Histidine kinase n=1 Tax=Spirosoma aureum TaxID=2692134 RepID=A0A6G9ARJ3_9BACT|nr:sensor histidine kinase [Spirosoma aureum]QIP14956.1 histidine kinase [Spirosoma aureum]